MTYLLDTNICIDHLRRRGTHALRRRLASINPGEIVLCSIVRAELLAGAYHSQSSDANRMAVDDLFNLFPSLPFDDASADFYGRLSASLAAQGTPIGSNDLMIASIALSRGLRLVTHNTREFDRIPGLVIEDWASNS